MAQIKVKQVAGLAATISALTGLDNIVEKFTTTATDGATGILITYSAKERDAVQIHVNGHKVQEGYSWQKGGSPITADALEANTELVWDAATAGYTLDATDEIEIRYETETAGSLSGGSHTQYTNQDVADYLNGGLNTHIIPATNAQYDLGSAEKKIRHLYLSNNSLYLGEEHIQMQEGKLQVPALRVAGEFDIDTKANLAQDLKSTEDLRMSQLYTEKISKATSPVWLLKGEAQYVGSGQWVSLQQDEQGNPTDLDQGWFLTCAHNIYDLVGSVHSFHDPIYIALGKEWYIVNPAHVYYDAVADVALIQTGLGLQADSVLKLAARAPKTGQPCWMVGFPGGLDNDSITQGIIRDAHFNITDGGQAVDSLFLTAPGIGGNSGSAILDAAGDIIGIFTFGYSAYETFGGGANWEVLNQVIPQLVLNGPGRWTGKRYLGIDWRRIGPHDWQAYLPVTDGAGGPQLWSRAQQQGCRITAVAADSPLQGILQPDDILLGCQLLDTGGSFEFGYTSAQRTPGVMIYQLLEANFQLDWIQAGTNARMQQVVNLTTYAATTEARDHYLAGGQNIITSQAQVQ